ncbi:co-chaperone GroES [Candidatus Gracilibacteria bacterium]|nr:co-chaperone GroES [Candidatus Gracilibacteria bacterium]
MLKKLRPLDDRILIEPVEEKTTTSFGLVLPESSSKEKPQKGMVLAVGPGKLTDEGKRVPMVVKVGDTILYTKYGPTEVKLEGKEIFFLQESDVLAIIG